jgi:hypothetical protein
LADGVRPAEDLEDGSISISAFLPEVQSTFFMIATGCKNRLIEKSSKKRYGDGSSGLRKA